VQVAGDPVPVLEDGQASSLGLRPHVLQGQPRLLGEPGQQGQAQRREGRPARRAQDDQRSAVRRRSTAAQRGAHRRPGRPEQCGGGGQVAGRLSPTATVQEPVGLVVRDGVAGRSDVA